MELKTLNFKSRDFVHLHTHSDYSLLQSAIQLKALAKRLNELDMKACAVTDYGNMFGAIEFYDRSDIVRMQDKFVRMRNAGEVIQRDLNRGMRSFVATAPRYGMSAELEKSVVRGFEETIEAEGNAIVAGTAPMYDAADRFCDFLLAHSDALDYDGAGQLVFLDERDEAEAAVLAAELEAAAQDAAKALAARQRSNMRGVTSIVPSMEGFRDW